MLDQCLLPLKMSKKDFFPYFVCYICITFGISVWHWNHFIFLTPTMTSDFWTFQLNWTHFKNAFLPWHYFASWNLLLSLSFPLSYTGILLDWVGILSMPCAPLKPRCLFCRESACLGKYFSPNLQNGICVAMDWRQGPGRVNINNQSCRPRLFG